MVLQRARKSPCRALGSCVEGLLRKRSDEHRRCRRNARRIATVMGRNPRVQNPWVKPRIKAGLRTREWRRCRHRPWRLPMQCTVAVSRGLGSLTVAGAVPDWPGCMHPSTSPASRFNPLAGRRRVTSKRTQSKRWASAGAKESGLAPSFAPAGFFCAGRCPSLRLRALRGDPAASCHRVETGSR